MCVCRTVGILVPAFSYHHEGSESLTAMIIHFLVLCVWCVLIFWYKCDHQFEQLTVCHMCRRNQLLHLHWNIGIYQRCHAREPTISSSWTLHQHEAWHQMWCLKLLHASTVTAPSYLEGARISAVSIVMDYGLHGWGIEVQFQARARDFSCLNSIQTSTGTHLAFCPVGTKANSQGVRWTMHDHSPSSAEVKNMFLQILRKHITLSLE
jgi:hypothetical protein